MLPVKWMPPGGSFMEGIFTSKNRHVVSSFCQFSFRSHHEPSSRAHESNEPTLSRKDREKTAYLYSRARTRKKKFTPYGNTKDPE